MGSFLNFASFCFYYYVFMLVLWTLRSVEFAFFLLFDV